MGSSKTISLTSLGKFDLGTNNGEYSYKMEMTNNVIVASHPYLDYITGEIKNHKNCLVDSVYKEILTRQKAVLHVFRTIQI